jgi:hypothetical protein
LELVGAGGRVELNGSTKSEAEPVVAEHLDTFDADPQAEVLAEMRAAGLHDDHLAAG